MPTHYRNGLQGTVQIAFLSGLWIAADWTVHALRWPVPGSIVALFFLLLMLAFGVLRPGVIATGAGWLLSEMLLFFIPVCVGILNYSGLFAREGFRLLVALMIGTVTVMSGTAWVVERVYWLEERWRSAPATIEEED